MTTIILSILALTVSLYDGAAAALQYDREAILAGQWWRLLTGHLTHWNADHLFWDLAVFMVLGVIYERIDRRGLVVLLMGSAAAISAGLFVGTPHIAIYRGLSGIDSALFTALTVRVAYDHWINRQHARTAVAVTMFIGFLGKLAFEVATGHTLFVDSNAAGFVPVPMSHAVGAAVGILVACTTLRAPRPITRPLQTSPRSLGVGRVGVSRGSGRA